MTLEAAPYMIPYRETRQLVEQAISKGWILKRTAHHYVLCAPNGHQRVVFSGTRIDARARKNVRAQLRRYGCAV